MLRRTYYQNKGLTAQLAAAIEEKTLMEDIIARLADEKETLEATKDDADVVKDELQARIRELEQVIIWRSIL